MFGEVRGVGKPKFDLIGRLASIGCTHVLPESFSIFLAQRRRMEGHNWCCIDLCRRHRLLPHCLRNRDMEAICPVFRRVQHDQRLLGATMELPYPPLLRSLILALSVDFTGNNVHYILHVIT